jgi:hypothetical protein
VRLEGAFRRRLANDVQRAPLQNESKRGAARERPTALAIRSVNFLTARTKISWNLFVGRLNYSCQREDDADLHDRSANAERPRTVAADHEVLDKTHMQGPTVLTQRDIRLHGFTRSRSMPLICSPRRGCLYRPYRRHQEPVYRRTGEGRIGWIADRLVHSGRAAYLVDDSIKNKKRMINRNLSISAC